MQEEFEKLDKTENIGNDIEETGNDIGEQDQGITSPFSVKDIKVTHATIMLSNIISRLKHKEISIPNYQRHANLWSIKQTSRLIESILLKLTSFGVCASI
jgi:hypothetical protein